MFLGPLDEAPRFVMISVPASKFTYCPITVNGPAIVPSASTVTWRTELMFPIVTEDAPVNVWLL